MFVIMAFTDARNDSACLRLPVGAPAGHVVVFDGVGVALIVSSGLCFAAWLAYLIFLVWVIKKHGHAALKDVAEAARAFPGTGFAAGVARGLTRGTRKQVRARDTLLP